MATAAPLASPATRFRVLMLGPFMIERAGAPLDTTRWQRRVASLFKLLVLAPNHRRLRDDVFDIFWPESDPASASGSLRVTAHRLRVSLDGGEPSPVVIDQKWVGLNAAYDWDVDVPDWERQAQDTGSDISALEKTLALWRGEPLDDERYEEWAIPIREHLQRLWRELTLRVATAAFGAGRYDRAQECVEAVLRQDPLDEEALQRLLEILFHAGKRVAGLRRYQDFERHLSEELDIPPSPETMAIVQRLNTEFPSPRPAESVNTRSHPLPIGRFLGALPEGPIVNRSEELGRILMAADLAEGGTGRLVLISSERGAGKTRLAQEVALRLRNRNFSVISGRCREGQESFAVAPFIDETAFLSGKELPGLEGADSPDRVMGGATEHQLSPTMMEDAIIAASEKQPVAVLLDDLQWADADSLELLHHLAREAGSHRILLLGTYRDDLVGEDHALSHSARTLTREGLLERVSLRRLTLEDTAALVDALLGDMEASTEFTEFVYRRTRGNPFFIDRMLQALGGQYSLMRQIGMGGMGRVFEAVNTSTGDLAAVKIMFSRTEADPRALHRFQREGAVLATLNHPNIVGVHDTVLDDFTHAIVMELLDGVPLSEILQDGPLPLSRSRHMAQQVTVALACAHEHGIVHRDIKPANIMVLGNDAVKVTDFGIARLVRPKGSITTMPSTGMTIGTPLYMSPEQIEGHRLDGRADIYSLAVVLYQAVTGRPPFAGDDPLTIAFKHVHDAPVPPQELNPEVPDDWQELILKGLAKDPADRYQTAAEMEQALAALSTLPRSATATDQSAMVANPPWPAATPEAATTIPEEKGTARRSRWQRATFAWGGTAAAGVLVAAGAWGLLNHQRSSPSALPPSITPKRHISTPIPAVNGTGAGPGQFRHPTGMAVEGNGNVLVVDSGNNRVQEFSSGGRWLRQIPSNPTVHSNSHLSGPLNVAVAPNGTILVTDFGNNRIARYTSNGQYLGEIKVPRTVDGTILAFNGLTVDNQGNIYVTDIVHSQVLKLSPQGTRLKRWGSSGHSPGQFYDPQGIALDLHGNILVAETGNNRVQKISFSGTPLRAKFSLFAGGQFGRGRDQFEQPQGVAVNRLGNVYVADSENARIQEFSSTGHPIGLFGQRGTARGQMSNPDSVAVDRQGNVYVADYSNNRIEKFSPTHHHHLLWERPRP